LNSHINFLRRSFFVLLAVFAACAIRAQQGAQEEELTTDFGTDDYVYIPKLTLNIGVRTISGSKASFWGNGVIMSAQQFGATTGTDVVRFYHDGVVYPDFRSVTDANGNQGSISPDGKTNHWAYSSLDQLTTDGFVAMHAYSAATADTSVRSRDPNNSYGLDLTITRDFGKLFNTRANWGIVGGVSINDLNSSMWSVVPANISTLTDYYSLDGQVPPLPPYFPPSITSNTLLDANGNPVLNSSGAIQTVTTDDSTLLGSLPLGRTTSTTYNTADVSTSWKLKGAYFSFRVGPSIQIPITQRLNINFSAGAVLVYAGTTYTVVQDLKPTASTDIINSVSDGVSEFLPGYFFDANVNYTFTDSAGAYIGMIYQASGSYVQTITSTPPEYTTSTFAPSATSTYSTRVDLNAMQGIRAGMTFRF
jgi:hypothetical protein